MNLIMNMIKTLISSGIACFGLGIASVSAYIDPGTTGMIIGGGIWPYIAIILAAISGFFLKFFWRPLKKFFVGLWKKIKRKN